MDVTIRRPEPRVAAGATREKHGLDGGVWETRNAELQHTAFLRRRGDTEAQNAVYANRNGLPSAVGKQSIRQLANTSAPLRRISLARDGSR